MNKFVNFLNLFLLMAFLVVVFLQENQNLSNTLYHVFIIGIVIACAVLAILTKEFQQISSYQISDLAHQTHQSLYPKVFITMIATLATAYTYFRTGIFWYCLASIGVLGIMMFMLMLAFRQNND